MIAGRLAGSLAQSERSINKSYNSLAEAEARALHWPRG